MACLNFWILTELDVVSVEVEHLGATKDSHVLELRLSDSWAVVGDDHQLGLSISQTFHDGLETYWQRKEKKGVLDYLMDNRSLLWLFKI